MQGLDPSRLEPAPNSFLYSNEIRICVRESGKALSEFRARSLEAKSPDPLHERGFHLYSQTGRLSREKSESGERERVMSRHIDTA